MNEIMTAEQIQDALGKFIVGASAMQKDIQTLHSYVEDEHNERVHLDERESRHYKELKTEIEIINDRERVDEEESNEFYKSVSARVTDLLKEHNRFDLFQSFSRKCWNDCKKYSYMCGRRGASTKKRFYSEVQNYIGKWEPVGHGGTAGYINHLDVLSRTSS